MNDDLQIGHNFKQNDTIAKVRDILRCTTRDGGEAAHEFYHGIVAVIVVRHCFYVSVS